MEKIKAGFSLEPQTVLILDRLAKNTRYSKSALIDLAIRELNARGISNPFDRPDQIAEASDNGNC